MADVIRYTNEKNYDLGLKSWKMEKMPKNRKGLKIGLDFTETRV